MSGGSHNYICYKVQDECVDKMYDVELNEMVEDFVELLHDLEWWQSCDTNEERYRKTVTEFKKKWFNRNINDVEKLINKKVDELKKELLDSFEYLTKN